MKKILFSFLLLSQLAFAQENNTSNQKNMELGAFSISLKVKDIKKSVEFYEKLGFTYKAGNIDQNWIVLINGSSVIGLFQGYIEENTLTFNPGWDQSASEVNPFTDVREIQKKLKEKGVKIDREANETTKGPEYIVLTDPDGNSILIDQHR
jgi:catechol 2,3-dioxygenase-like lactoylglutathione lyase family enzyme